MNTVDFLDRVGSPPVTRFLNKMGIQSTVYRSLLTACQVANFWHFVLRKITWKSHILKVIRYPLLTYCERLTYIGDIVDVAGVCEQLNALYVVSLYSQVQRTESSASA